MGPPEARPREFIVSADGDARVFPTVKRLVAAAPAIPGWRIIAFRQRKTVPTTLSVDSVTLTPTSVRFQVLAQPSGTPLKLTLYIDQLRPDNRERLTRAAWLLLDSVIGEYDATTRIAAIELKPTPPAPLPAGLRPLAELASVVVAQ